VSTIISPLAIDRNVNATSNPDHPALPPSPSDPSDDDGRVDRIIGTDSMGADIFGSDLVHDDETDAEWLARIEREEAIEKDRVLSTYRPSAEDLAEYAAWCAALEAELLPPAAPRRFSFGSFASCYAPDEWNAILTGQVSLDELAMLAAGMPVG
jgi:hypothetical protein